MRGFCPLSWLPRLAVAATVVLTAATLSASDRIKGVGKFNPQDETVELFSAVEDGKLEVKLIPKDSSQCRVLITNKTAKPLNVILPDAFAGVPVLAQLQVPPGNFNNFNNPNNLNNASQQLGIGNQFGNNFLQGNRGNQFFNMPGAGNNLLPGAGPALGPNFAPFNVAPEKVAQLKLASVCLDHGKPDPRPAMPYEIKPIDSVTHKRGVDELCGMLGRGQVGQRAAQAAAWHLNNDMSWDQLAGLRLKFAFGPISEPFFTREELAEGKKAAETAIERANQRESPAKADSLSLR